jgi:hypothetical protein
MHEREGCMHLATRNWTARHSPAYPPSSLPGMFWRFMLFLF